MSGRIAQERSMAASTVDAALIERIRKLAAILPAMAQDTAEARSEAARLRRENLALKTRLLEVAELDG